MKAILPPALAAVLVHAALLGAFVAVHHGDPGALVCVGHDRLGAHPFTAVGVGFGKNGYDGQFYYAIAQHPWQVQADGVDCPVLRHARILYPALCWLLTGGDADALLWVMPLVNLLAIGGLAAVGAAFARSRSLSPWWGVLLPCAVNAGLPALRDLTDVVSACALACLLVGWHMRWSAAALTAAALAALLARDPNLPVVMVVLAGAIFRRDVRSAAGLSLALVLWLGWMTVLRDVYGGWPFTAVRGDLGSPGRGLAYAWTHLLHAPSDAPASSTKILIHGLLLGHLVFQLGLTAGVSLFGGADRVFCCTALGGAALVVLGDAPLYSDFWGYERVFVWMSLGCWLAAAQLRQRWAMALVAVSALAAPAYVIGEYLRATS
jgi:hypothetical protein